MLGTLSIISKSPIGSVAIGLGYTFFWGYEKKLPVIKKSNTYENFIKTGIDFVIAYDKKGYSICRQAGELEKIYDRTGRHKSTMPA